MTVLNFSAHLRIFGYFGKVFDYGSQFSLSPGSLRVFSLWILRRLNFKRIGSDKFRGKGSGESFKETGKFGERICMGELKM